MKRILLVFMVCMSLHAESRLAKWTRRAMVAGYCAASAVDGWQSTRPGAIETNSLLRNSDGSANVVRMVTFKASSCAGLILSERLAKGKTHHAVSAGVATMLGAQVVTDIHNGKVAH